MAFALKKNESLSKAARRLSCGRIDQAIKCLQDCKRSEAIHCARKEIKKVRAVVRLFRTQIPKRRCRRITRLLRKAAGALAAARDAHVQATTLKSLINHSKGRVAPGALRRLHACLRATAHNEFRRFCNRRTARVVEKTLRRTAREVACLKLTTKGWKALAPGVKTAFQRGQCAYRAVLRNPLPEHFHEWRKDVKALWYQTTILRPLAPKKMDATARELKTLGENLGDDNDLAILLSNKIVKTGPPDELKIVKRLVNQRHKHLRAAALARGSRFYAGTPSQFCKRLEGFWQTWCQ